MAASSSDYNSSWAPKANATSAHVGDAPNTQRDWYIVRGLLRAVGEYDADPADGYFHASKDTGEAFVSKRPAIMAGLVIVLAAILLVTVTRLALRASVSQMRFGLDDWATIAAASMGLTYTCCQLVMAMHGGGDHIASLAFLLVLCRYTPSGPANTAQWQRTYEDYYIFNYYGTLDKLIFYITVALVKVSLTLFIRRLADRASSVWRWFCDLFLLTLAAYVAVAVFWFSFTCDPPRAQWDKRYSGALATPATCADATLQGAALNVAHVLQGVVLLASPVAILWTVTIEPRKKARLFVVWAVGLLAVLFGLMRLVRGDFTSDVTWTYTELLVWTCLDVSVGIVVISLPVMDAWLAGGWRSAMTRLGADRSRASAGARGGGGGKSGYGNLERGGGGGGGSSSYATAKSTRTIGGTSDLSGGRHSSKEEYYYAEAAAGGGGGGSKGDAVAMELAIMRTDEYDVEFARVGSSAGAGGQQLYGAYACATPRVDSRFTGIARR